MKLPFRFSKILPWIALLALPFLAWQQWQWTTRISEDEARRLRSYLETGTYGVTAAFDKTMSDLAHELSTVSKPDSASVMEAIARWTSNGRYRSLRWMENIWIVSVNDSGFSLKPLLNNQLPDSGTSELLTQQFRGSGISKTISLVTGLYFAPKPVLISSSLPPQVHEQAQPGHIAIAFDPYQLQKFLMGPLVDSLLAKSAGERVIWSVVSADSATVMEGNSLGTFAPDLRAKIGVISSMRILVMSSGDTDSLKFNWIKTGQPKKVSINTFSTYSREFSRTTTALPVDAAAAADVFTRVDSVKLSKIQHALPFTEKAVFPALQVRYGVAGIDGTVTGRRRRDFLLNALFLLVLAAGIIFSVRAAAEAENLAQRQMEFVATVTHELRTPVAVIRSAAQNLSDGLVATPERTAQYGGLLADESRRLGDLIENVLAFSGLTSNAIRLKPVQLDFSKVVRDVLAALDGAAKHKHLDLELEIPAACPFFADPNAMRLLASNVIENAIKYSNPGGKIRVSVSCMSNEILFVVQDHGMGIASADLPHIFEPFRRGRHAVEQQIKGSGLGLHLVKKFVELHHGTVQVESTIRVGTMFTIRFPKNSIGATA
jgi:signal transduction histidine kinase